MYDWLEGPLAGVLYPARPPVYRDDGGELFVSSDAEGEDDVEDTRDELLDAGAAFYCIAPEAAFERCWLEDWNPRSYRIY